MPELAAGFARLHAEASGLLASWDAPSPSQDALAQAYLAFLDARPDACARACLPGHLTASALVFSHDLGQVALVLHGIAGIWVQAGGHLEASDQTIADAARREAREELGIEVDLDPTPATLDCHEITCRGFTRPTRHFDVRFVGRALPGATLTCSDESHAVRWWPADALPDGVPADVVELIHVGRRRLSS